MKSDTIDEAKKKKKIGKIATKKKDKVYEFDEEGLTEFLKYSNKTREEAIEWLNKIMNGKIKPVPKH